MNNEDPNINDEGQENAEDLTAEEMADELAELLDSAREQSDTIKELHAAAKKAAQVVANSQTAVESMQEEIETSAKEITELKLTATQDSKAVSTTRQEAKTSFETVSDLEARADQLEKKIVSGTSQLQELEEKNTALTEQIESLLPGATSTGLASSFMNRKSEYKTPKVLWTIGALTPIAVLAVVGLVGDMGLIELVQTKTFKWEAILEGILLRLPVTGPLIWFAVYAGRHHYLTSRLEEDYAYKEAVSRAFEGYKREMGTVKPEASEALATLCTNVLNTVAQSPGRLYDKKHQDFTPLNVAIETLDESTINALAKTTGVTPDNVQTIIRALPGLVGQKRN